MQSAVSAGGGIAPQGEAGPITQGKPEGFGRKAQRTAQPNPNQMEQLASRNAKEERVKWRRLLRARRALQQFIMPFSRKVVVR